MKFLLENESYAFPPNLTGVSTKMILYIAITNRKDVFCISEIVHFSLHGLMKTRGTCLIGPSLPLFHTKHFVKQFTSVLILILILVLQG